jgi:hypothetical protein
MARASYALIGERRKNITKVGIQLIHNYRGMMTKHQGTGDRADPQLQGNEDETPGNWG